ncbi:monovalent cation/H(+) antiporter subunit G [Anaerobacillus isosaccharinicus]|uniref:Na+/H+ antiporter subunit G n=1 Tax=Anaerobacillus isosaccharinicus TaxID=1532552 RepID=A0A1S2KZZ8_9BACI|nr:monovalent cation/H(+) antiporter subunit G [Anaerobacillus isosaccharinicus]MBA5584823.1 Na+/H+ antiporter subunit G [Anaerobacillus isosaccharinicus]QOY36814.1 Na+/H+ antiporter subunit G [Anaerobacillus isosaccharinicus]
MNANTVSEIITGILILTGTLFCLFSAFGMIRLPDVYTRSHAATKSTTLGVLCTLFGAFLYFWINDGYVSIRLLLGIFFVFLTAPVAGHLICRAAYVTNVEIVQDASKVYVKESDSD